MDTKKLQQKINPNIYIFKKKKTFLKKKINFKEKMSD